MSYICNLCSNTFTQKKNLLNHLNNKRCKSDLLNDLVKLNQLLENIPNNNCVIPSIDELNLDFITHDYFKDLILTEFNDTFYHNNPSIVSNNSQKSNNKSNNKSSSDFIKIKHILKTLVKDIVCNKKYPQNQIIKYSYIDNSIKLIFTIDKHIYKNNVKDISLISESCNNIVSHFINKLQDLFSIFIQYYEHDDKDFDYSLYEYFILKLKKHINQNIISKILKNTIYKTILKNKRYKIKMIE
jgi:hypothetical protein